MRRRLFTSLRLVAPLASLALGVPALLAGDQPSVRRGVDHVATVAPVAIERRLIDQPLAGADQRADEHDAQERAHESLREAPVRPVTPPTQPDPLLPRQRAADTRRGLAPTTFGTPILNFAGSGTLGSLVGDPVGDVGPGHYVQAANAPSGTQVRVFDKAGALLAGPTLLNTLAPVGSPCANGFGDPMVVYDRWADRWVLSEMSRSGNRLCFYVSQSSNPASTTWWFYAFHPPYFPDYQKVVAWHEAYYVTTDDGGGPARIHALERSAMLNGQPAVHMSLEAGFLPGQSFKNVTPADPDGVVPPPPGAPGLFARQVDSALRGDPADPDRLELFTFAPNFSDPPASVLVGPVFLPLAPFDSNLCGSGPGCIPQPDGAPTLWPLWEVIMHRLQYRNFRNYQAVVGSFAVDVDGADHSGIRWFELRNTGSGWTLYQEGTYAPDGDHRWVSTTALDGHGNLALGFSVSSTSTYPAMRYTGRSAGAPLGVLDQGEASVIASFHSRAASRWGDYASINVDPVDECTFWYTGMHMPDANWATRIATMKFDLCVPFVKGDLDQDQQADLVFRNATSGEHQIWLMNGSVRPGAPVTLVPAPAASQLLSGVDDFDGDHRNDLAFWDPATGAVEFWLMNGVTRVGAPLPLTGLPPLPAPWKLSASADFDRDGQPDLLWRNEATQKIVIWTLNGLATNGTLAPVPDQAVNANWEIVGALDFSGDGYVDLLWYNSTSGKIVSWFMDAALQRTSGDFTNPSNAGNNNWKVLASADYGIGPDGPDAAPPQPGTYDMVWRNASSGRIVVWHMDAARRRTSGLFTSPDAPVPNPTEWAIVGPH